MIKQEYSNIRMLYSSMHRYNFEVFFRTFQSLKIYFAENFELENSLARGFSDTQVPNKICMLTPFSLT